MLTQKLPIARDPSTDHTSTADQLLSTLFSPSWVGTTIQPVQDLRMLCLPPYHSLRNIEGIITATDALRDLQLQYLLDRENENMKKKLNHTKCNSKIKHSLLWYKIG